jgi:hypothetical protein
MLQERGILQIEVADRRSCRSNFPRDGIVAETRWQGLGGTSGYADIICQICQYGAEHFLFGNTLLKTADGISGDSVHSQRNLERQRLQLLQIAGGELIVGLDCFVIHA